MDSIALYNQNGQKFDVEVIRYFENNSNKYLIFSLNEIDDNGYIQLYLSKVVGKDMVTVTDDSEWSDFRSAIQKIVTNNRNNIEIENDLDFNELNEYTVSNFRIFKLKSDVAKILAANKNTNKPKEEEPIKEVVAEEVKEEPKNLQDASARDTGLTIEEILKKVSEGAKNARDVVKVNLAKVGSKEEKTEDKEEAETSENDDKYDELLKTDDFDYPAIIAEPLPDSEDEVENKKYDELLKTDDFDYPAIIAKPLPDSEDEVENKKYDELLKTDDFDYPAIIAKPLPGMDEENSNEISLKEIKVDSLPEVDEAEVKNEKIDYQAKYNEVLATMQKLEEENMRLINEVIEAKARIATIKDIIN